MIAVLPVDSAKSLSWQRLDSIETLKDSDNCGWLAYLPPKDQQAWVLPLKWMRLADTLAESQLLDNHTNFTNKTCFDSFYDEWQYLLENKYPKINGVYKETFQEIYQCWFFKETNLTSKSIEAWNKYLKANFVYHRPDLIIHSLENYELMLSALSGSILQTFPFLLNETQYKNVRYLGILDQFLNNLRDLAEDTKKGICYFPYQLLQEFGVTQNEILKYTCFTNPGYYKMLDFWLNNYLPKLYRNASIFIEDDRLHPSWKKVLTWTLERYHRIEHTFRSVNYNFQVFPQEYWNLVKIKLDL